MNWLLRYIIGLPARKQDVKELNENFPELIDNPEKLRELEYPYFIHPRKLGSEYFKKWISEIDYEDKTINDSVTVCPLTNCPLNNQDIINSNSENELLQLMSIGTGHNSPQKSFFDMVRRVYQNKPNIKKVILTDPYLLADISEDGIEGGFNNLVEYLNIIIRDKESKFELQISKTLKKQLNFKNFKRMVIRNFPNVEINNYDSPYHIHDRFYITVDDKNNFNGLFGPSINGLNSRSIVIFGELESKNTMDRLKKWFN